MTLEIAAGQIVKSRSGAWSLVRADCLPLARWDTPRTTTDARVLVLSADKRPLQAHLILHFVRRTMAPFFAAHLG